MQLCTYEKLVSDGTGDGTGSGRTSWLMTVSELHYFKDSSPVEIPMVCQKIVGTDGTTFAHLHDVSRCTSASAVAAVAATGAQL